MANIAFAKGLKEEGKVQKASADAPRHVSNYMALCTEYEKEGNWEEAKKFCEQAHEVDSTAPIVADLLFFILSMAAMSMSRLD